MGLKPDMDSPTIAKRYVQSGIGFPATEAVPEKDMGNAGIAPSGGGVAVGVGAPSSSGVGVGVGVTVGQTLPCVCASSVEEPDSAK